MTQREALDILKTGKSVFLTGAAGSGKTYVLRQYIEYLKSLDATFGVTASTGIAATHMGGVTIHSWSGIGIRESLDRDELEEIAQKSHVRSRLQDTKVLIIDEISMLHDQTLNLVDLVLKKVKNSLSPFGGIQVVFCGDFFQLPPVRKAGETEVFFAYHANAWKELGLKVCYLSEQHRQNDQSFLRVLNAIRDNEVDDWIYEILEKRFDKEIKDATKLYSHNKNVDLENDTELGRVGGRVSEYEMESRGKEFLVETLKKSCLAPEVLRLKVGAKVMFVKNNFEEGYVNGTLGIVVKCGFEDIKVRTLSGVEIDVPRESWVIEEDGKIKAEISQYPLRLAWAITVHKSQGMSLDAAEIDLSRSFEKGMGYVALSRVRSLEGLYLRGLNDLALRVNDEVLEFDKNFRNLSEENSYQLSKLGNEKILKIHKEFADSVRGESGNKRKKKTKKLDTVTETRLLLDQGMSIKEIAKQRNLNLETIIGHIEKIKKDDPRYNIYNLQNTISRSKFRSIYATFQKIGVSENGERPLTPVRNLLGPKYSYGEIRLVRLFL